MTMERRVPSRVWGTPAACAVFLGLHPLAARSDGTASAWGWNGSGQLGTGTTTAERLPVAVRDLDHLVQVAAGYHHSMALRADGIVAT